MSVSIVNGYVCFNCTDQEKAQKGIDPANPTNDPSLNPATVAKEEATTAIAKAAAENGTASGAATATGSAVVVSALLAPGTGGLLDLTA